MNKLEKNLAKLKKMIEEYNARARKYGWVEVRLEISDVDHSREFNGLNLWNDHFYSVTGGYASCKKNVFLLMFQHLFIMRPRYKKMQNLAFKLSSIEYVMNHDRAVDKHNEEEMNSL